MLLQSAPLLGSIEHDDHLADGWHVPVSDSAGTNCTPGEQLSEHAECGDIVVTSSPRSVAQSSSEPFTVSVEPCKIDAQCSTEAGSADKFERSMLIELGTCAAGETTSAHNAGIMSTADATCVMRDLNLNALHLLGDNPTPPSELVFEADELV